MTEKELSQYYWLKIEIEKIENQIIEFGDGVGAVKYSDGIKSAKKQQSIQEKKMELVNKLTNARLSALEKYLEIENYIETVDDPEIRLIMRYRFLNLKDWYFIGEELHCDRTTASKKMRDYLKKNKISHISHRDMK